MNRQVPTIIPLSVATALAGCAPPATVGFNGYSVTIRASAPQEQDKKAARLKQTAFVGKSGSKLSISQRRMSKT